MNKPIDYSRGRAYRAELEAYRQKDRDRRFYQNWVIGICLVLIIVMFIAIMDPFAGGGNDAGVAFDDEVTTTEFEVTDAWLIAKAETALTTDPTGICRDVMLLDERSAITLIRSGSQENDGVALNKRQATVLYDVWVEACQS